MAADIKVVRSSDIDRCPKRSMYPYHYRSDGTCKCDEREAAAAELRAAKNDFERAHERVQDAEHWLRST